MKLCVDCKHARATRKDGVINSLGAKCDVSRFINKVTGEEEFNYCCLARDEGAPCGPDGAKWEEK